MNPSVPGTLRQKHVKKRRSQGGKEMYNYDNRKTWFGTTTQFCSTCRHFAGRPQGKMPAEAPHNIPASIPDVQVKPAQRAPRRKFSTAYKLKILETYEACDNALARGALLRKEGLYHSRVNTWRKQRDEGTLGSKVNRKTPASVLASQQLTRENVRLKKKLARAEAIIELQKKVFDLLGTHILPPESSETS